MKFLFFDTECSNCFNGIGKICEFGYILTDDNFKVKVKYEIPMSPGRGSNNKFHLRAYGKHKPISLAFDESYYYTQPEFDYYYGEIKKLMEDKDTICFAWSSDNDIQHLYNSCMRYSKEPIHYICYDVQKIFGKYIETSKQKSLKESCLHLVGATKMIDIQEHLSSDDSKMAMLILEKICELKNIDSLTLLQESDYAKDDSIEYMNNFNIHKKEKEIAKANIALYRRVEEEDKEKSLLPEYENKKYRLHSDIIHKEMDLSSIIDVIHNRGGILVNDLNQVDFYVIYKNSEIPPIGKDALQHFKGQFIFLEDLIEKIYS